jgi:hypothetical protein
MHQGSNRVESIKWKCASLALGDHQVCLARHNFSLGMNAEGIFRAEKLFGATIVNGDGKQIPARHVGEQHVREDLGRIPPAQDWLSPIRSQHWMYGQRLDGKTLAREEVVG